MTGSLISLNPRRYATVPVECTSACLQWTKPTNRSRLGEGDAHRSRPAQGQNSSPRTRCSASNSVILHRQVKRPTCTRPVDSLLLLLARAVRNWKQALYIVQPDTLLGWHRQAFRWYWRHRSKATSRKPKIAAETVVLIKTMALNNRLWGAERIRGELLKLGIRVSKRTIQKLYAPTAWAPYFSNVVELPTQSCARDLGVRLLADH